MRVWCLWLLVLILSSPLSLAASTATLDSFKIGVDGRFEEIEVDEPAAVYTLEFDLTAGQIANTARQTVILNMYARNVWGSSGGNNAGGLGVLQDGRITMITRDSFGTSVANTFDEGQRPRWNPVPGKTYKVVIVFDSVNLRQTFHITGNGADLSRDASLPQDAVLAVSKGFLVEFGRPRADNDGEANADGWLITNAVLTGSGEASTTLDPSVPSSTISWLQNLVNGAGFSPEESDPAGIVQLSDPSFSFTPSLQTPTRNIELSSVDAYEKINITFEVTIPSQSSPGQINPIVDVRNLCSGKRIMQLSLRTPYKDQPGQVLIDARGAPKIITGATDLTPGDYKIELTYDLADEEVYAKVTRIGGQVTQITGGALNSDYANIVRANQTEGGVRLIFGTKESNSDQLINAPFGWAFKDITLTTVIPGTQSGDTGAQGADFLSDDGRLAFLAATLADAAREEGSDWSLDCGKSAESLPIPPSQPQYAGEKYCVLDIDGEIVFGTFGTSQGTQTVESRILTSLKDAAYVLHIQSSDIDASACDSIDTTTLEFQECVDAIAGMRTYSLVHALSGTSFIIVSDSGIDAFDVSWLEQISGIFTSLFGLDEQQEIMSGVPLRRFHHAFLAHQHGREVAATWVDGDATLLYRSFTTNLTPWTLPQAEYALAYGAQVFTAELDAQTPDDVRAWRQLTSGLRIQDISGDPIGGGVCGDGSIDLGETCEPTVETPTCGSISLNESDVRPIPCGGLGSVASCRLDVGACGFSSACGDDWVPVPRPLPCGTPMVEEPGDDPLCIGEVGSGCREGFCFCSKAMMSVIRGEPVDFDTLADQHFGADAANMFTHGGSQNIPVMCRAARYYAQGGAQDSAWFMEYYTWQRENNRHSGTEIFSPVYAPAITAANEIVHDKAKKMNNAELTEESKEWLRHQWGLVALGTANIPMRSFIAQVNGNPETIDIDDRWTGTTSALAATRSLPSLFAWFGFHKAVAYAADTSPRTGQSYNKFPVHTPIILSGNIIDISIDIPDVGTIAPEYFGITAEDRAAMQQMINNHENYAGIAAMVGGARPAVSFTFVRTSEGVMSYIGTWAPGDEANPTGYNVNSNKASTMATQILNNGMFRILYPHTTAKTGAMTITSWREEVAGTNGRVCGKNLDVLDCLDLPGGELLLVAEWNQDEGLKCVAGSKCPTTTGGSCGFIISQGSYDIIGQTENGVKQIKIVYVRDSPNGNDKEATCYQNGGSVNSDVGQITFPSTWISHQQGTETVVYQRLKYGDGYRYDLKIVARADATGWIITGTPEGVASNNNFGAGHTCWMCNGDYCDDMNIRIDLTSVYSSTCADDPVTNGGGGGGGGGDTDFDRPVY